MSKAYVGDQVEIESSSDTVEQVKAALGAAVEIDESPTEETETEKKPPVKEEAEEAEGADFCVCIPVRMRFSARSDQHPVYYKCADGPVRHMRESGHAASVQYTA